MVGKLKRFTIKELASATPNPDIISSLKRRLPIWIGDIPKLKERVADFRYLGV